MMLAADIYDVSPRSSAVVGPARPRRRPVGRRLRLARARGGRPRAHARRPRRRGRPTPSTRCARGTGRDVHLAGYSPGRDVLLPGRRLPPRRGPREPHHLRRARSTRAARCRSASPRSSRCAARACSPTTSSRATRCPAWVSRAGFRLLDPVKSLRQQVDFVAGAARPRGAAAARAPAPVPRGARLGRLAGPGARRLHRQFIAHNRMLSGGFVIEDRLVTLADIDLPGARPSSARSTRSRRRAPCARSAARRRAPRSTSWRCAPGTSASSSARRATRDTWPTVAAWAHWRDGDERDAAAATIRQVERRRARPAGAGRDPRRRRRWSSPPASALGVARSIARRRRHAPRRARRRRREAAGASCRGSRRLERVQPRTRISLGLLLDEQAAQRADRRVVFLFEDRAYTQGAVKDADRQRRARAAVARRAPGRARRRADGRRGRARSRVVAALNRLGAVARAAAPRRRRSPARLELGRLHARRRRPRAVERARARPASRACSCSAAAARPRDLGGGVVDMERIDPDAVELPDWYAPNPGRARDLAFVLFTGEGERTRVQPDHERALGAVGVRHRVLGGAVDRRHRLRGHADLPPVRPADERRRRDRRRRAARARDELRPADVLGRGAPLRRHRRLVHVDDAARRSSSAARPRRAPPPDAAVRRRRACRAGCGGASSERFAPARVLEFYTSTEGDAVLVNLAGAKRGCEGPAAAGQPRAADRRVRRRSRAGSSDSTTASRASARAARPGCCSRASGPAWRRDRRAPLRGVFARDDAWRATGDLFQRDLDGDYWLVGDVRGLIRTDARASSRRCRSPRRWATSTRSTSRSPTACRRRRPAPEEIVVAAITQRTRTTLTPPISRRRWTRSSPTQRPHVVHVVAEIPLTTWHRPLAGPLRARGLPARRPARLGARRRPLPAASQAERAQALAAGR